MLISVLLNQRIVMKLFCLNEHTSCYNYARCVQEGFRYYTFDKGLEHEEELQNDCILFVLKGSLRFSYNEFQFTISAGKMVFVCRESLFSTYSLEKCEVVVALFESGVWPCQKISFSELSYLRDIIEYRMEPLEIKDRLYRFLELLECYLKDGANCIHFHEIKIKELFWNMRFYYSKRELASFFYMVIGRSQGFRNMVLNNYKKCKTVKELASVCGISISSFKRQFAAEFGETPTGWMQKQLVREIKYKLSITDLPLGSIVYELNFSSLAHFSRFCKRCLGCSPKEWREQMKNNLKTF